MDNNLEEMKARFLELSAELAECKAQCDLSFDVWNKAKKAVQEAKNAELKAQSAHSQNNLKRFDVAQKHQELAWQISDLVAGTPKEQRYGQLPLYSES